MAANWYSLIKKKQQIKFQESNSKSEANKLRFKLCKKQKQQQQQHKADVNLHIFMWFYCYSKHFLVGMWWIFVQCELHHWCEDVANTDCGLSCDNMLKEEEQKSCSMMMMMINYCWILFFKLPYRDSFEYTNICTNYSDRFSSGVFMATWMHHERMWSVDWKIVQFHFTGPRVGNHSPSWCFSTAAGSMWPS